MSKKLKIGIIGAGVFGGYHAGKCAAHGRIDFFGVCDSSFDCATALAEKFNVKAYPDAASMLAEVDAVIIAAPASQHGGLALQALGDGCHVLIEKPIAHTSELAEQVVALAKHKGLIIQVGHQERFVVQAIGLDQVSETPIAITAHRRSPYSPRGTDVSATLDLMTHDLDLVLWLMDADPDLIEGEALCVKSTQPDVARARLKFNGSVVDLEASRVEEKSSRRMKIKYPSGTVDIDFNAKTLVNGTPFYLDENFGDNPAAKDSLGAATHAFVEAILDGKPVAITGGSGLRALKAALKIDGML